MAYRSSKTYGHEIGLSCSFRQWKASSHCSKIHGYALSFKFTFECDMLDYRNWCIDFGGLKDLKHRLEEMFDHTLLVAQDDPYKEVILDLDRKYKIATVVEVDRVGCEAVAKLAYDMGCQWLRDMNQTGRVWLVSVEVKEHGANGAEYIGNRPDIDSLI